MAGWGLELAVPINDTSRQTVATLVRDRRVRRAYLGLVSSPVPLPAELAVRTGKRRGFQGFQVLDVIAGSSAERVGPKAGDLVLDAGAGAGGVGAEPAAAVVRRGDRAAAAG